MDEKALESRRKYQREWQRRNREKVREYQKKWRLKNPDKVRDSHREWQRQNKDKVKSYQETYWAKKAAAAEATATDHNGKDVSAELKTDVSADAAGHAQQTEKE